MASGSFAFRYARLMAIGAVLTSSFEAQAAYYCLNVGRLPELSDARSRERIESYMKSHYPLTTIQIRRFDSRFFVVLPENQDCKPCYYHIIALGDSDVTEPFVFEGTGTILTWDAPFWRDRQLGEDYTFYYLEQSNKSYLFVGFPRLGSAPLLSPVSSEFATHPPRC